MTAFSSLTDGGNARTTDEIAAVRGGATVRVHPVAGGGGAFDLHDDVTTEMTAPAGADRLVISDESQTGDPNRWLSLTRLATYLKGQIGFDVHDDLSTEAAALADNDRVPMSDESVNGDPNRYVQLSSLASYVNGKITGFVRWTGGTMTGKLTLDGAPTADLHAATKKYVDDNAGSGGEDNVQSDWNETDAGSDAFIKNKPTIPDGGDAGNPAMQELLLDSTLGADNNEVDLGVTIENDSNVAYLIQSGTNRRYVLGSDLYASRVASAYAVGPARYYSKGGGNAGKLYQDIFTSWVETTVLRVWQVKDINNFKDILDEIEPDHVDELRDDLSKLHTYIAEHVTDISSETLNPTVAAAPAHYYLTERARHTVRGVSVAFESGLYELTTGPENACQFKMARRGTGTSQIHGYVGRNHDGLANQGEVLHNPLSAIAALYMQQQGSNYYLFSLLKSRVYDVLREQHNLANTAIWFNVGDGTTDEEFEMSLFEKGVISGVEYQVLRYHMTNAAARARWTSYFTSGNSFSPTLSVKFNQSAQQAGRSDSPISYLGTTATTKAYTFRENGFANIAGLNDGVVMSDDVSDIVKLTQAEYDALSSKDAKTFYAIVG